MSNVTIYAVSRGEYDDYEIVALCSTRELAQELVDKYEESECGRYMGIEEYILDGYRDHTFVRIYCVALDENGAFHKQWDFMTLASSGEDQSGSGHFGSSFGPGFRGRSAVSFGDAQRLALEFFVKHKEDVGD